MPTEIIRSIISGGGGDYALLSTFESGEQRSLTAADEIAVAACQSGSITNTVNFSGWTTDATRYIVVRPASGHEHGGLPTGGFKITNTGTVMELNQDCRIEGIVVEHTSTGFCIITGNTGPFERYVNGCVVFSSGSGTDGIKPVGLGNFHILNNIIYDVVDGIELNRADAVGHVYNNTVVGCTNGIRQVAGTLRPKNNIAQNCSSACFLGTMTNSATNISEDATSPQTGLRNISLTFVDAANDNYHLAASDTAAIGAGTDLTADANLAFSVDIDGNTRPAAAWDIGADEFVSGAITEALPANTVLATSNLKDTGLNAPPLNTGDIDEDPASPDANWWTAVNVGLATDARVGFPTPSTGTPTGTQTFYIWVRKTTGTQNPTVDVELWEGGNVVATLLNDIAITSTTGQLLTATFNAAGSPPSLTVPADVEVRIVSTPGIAA